SYGTLGILRGFVPNQGDAWAMMTDEVSKFYDSALAAPEAPDQAAPPCELRAMDLKSVPQQVVNLTGAVALEMAVTLGRRTAEMHRALAAPHPAVPAFSTEPFSKLHQRSLYQSMSGHARKTLLRFSKKLRELPQDARENTLFLLENQQKIFRLMQKLTEKKFSGRKMRIHGNYILEQALFTGKEFAIKDFDGDLNKPPEERRIKRSPLRDVAEMLLSIYYSAYAPFLFTGRRPRKELETFSRWTDLWYVHVSGAFLKGYLDLMRDTQLIPQPDEDFYQLLRIYLADGALSKLESEALLRPDWTVVPASFLRRLMESSRECKMPESRP
ncbi:MAG: alpha-amylase, partial [Elusimicrobia bacterium]|nr:alpha-amylase [Elusimicrobiota bacterium]